MIPHSQARFRNSSRESPEYSTALRPPLPPKKYIYIFIFVSWAYRQTQFSIMKTSWKPFFRPVQVITRVFYNYNTSMCDNTEGKKVMWSHELDIMGEYLIIF